MSDTKQIALVLDSLDLGPGTSSSIAAATRLPRGNVSAYLHRLRCDGIVRVVDKQRGERGRPAMRYELRR